MEPRWRYFLRAGGGSGKVAAMLRPPAAALLLLLAAGCTTADFRAAEEKLREQKYYMAIELFLSFVKEHPEHRRAPEALLEVGRIQQAMLGEPKKALETYRALVGRYPISRFTLAGQRRIAEIYRSNLADYRQAIVEYGKLIQAAPGDPDAAEFQFEIARAYTLLHQYEQAQIEYRTLIDQYPEYGRMDEVYFQMGNNAYIGGRYPDAVAAYRAVLTKFPKSAFVVQARFGLGNAHEEMDEWDLARAEYQAVARDYPSPKVVAIRLRGLAERQRKKTAVAPGANLRK